MDRSRVRLSVVDTAWPGGIGRLARDLDVLGYHRLWASEHHTSFQSASPTVVSAIVASVTTNIRAGSAAVLLNYSSPRKVAEDFSLLELLYPGRIDLGVSGGSVFRHVAEALAGAADTRDFESYSGRVRDLLSYVNDGGSQIDGEMHSKTDFGLSAKPCVWICGTSTRTARLAGELGLSFSYHHFLGGGADRKRAQTFHRDVIQTYLDSFRRGRNSAAPEFNVAAYGFCSADAARAAGTWERAVGALHSGPADFLGTARQCREQILELADAYQTDEIVIQSMAESFSDRLDSYAMLAEAFSIAPAPHVIEIAPEGALQCPQRAT